MRHMANADQLHAHLAWDSLRAWIFGCSLLMALHDHVLLLQLQAPCYFAAGWNLWLVVQPQLPCTDQDKGLAAAVGAVPHTPQAKTRWKTLWQKLSCASRA